MDIVFIKNCKVLAKHGYYKEEHAKAQNFIVSVYAKIDTKEAGGSDDLKKTLNYEHIRKYIYEVLEQSPRSLVEALASEIADKVLKHDVVSVEVEIEKPDVWGDCIPGVRITRRK
ncbi:dihydroneopterin aldolase [Candidatus Gracilibacteria bacterium]|nr:dihydroneopterin aldolase [Candidatus Gracilibacteria bacterium]